MDKLQESLNKIDKIINTIEKNNSLKKTEQGENLKNIIQLNQKNKDRLEEKLITIDKFSGLLENIIKNKPKPTLFNKELIEYIDYDNYYSKNKK